MSTASQGDGAPKANITSIKEPLPQLGALEEDDEFEEFAVEDWDTQDSELSSIVNYSKSSEADQNGEKTAITNDNLWQDNWDDDDVEDDFSKQLRAAIKDESAMQIARG